MPLGATLKFKTTNAILARLQTSNGCPWQSVVDAQIAAVGSTPAVGGPNVADSAKVTRPDQVALLTRHVMVRRDSMGKFLQLRLRYDDGIAAVIVAPIVKVFGRNKLGEAWTLLRNRAGDLSGTLAIDATTDVQDGTYGYTTPHSTNTTWEVAGCDEMLVVVETAFSATGDVTTSRIEGKLF